VQVDLKVLLGGRLISKDGTKVKVEELEGKTIGLYFSAHWWVEDIYKGCFAPYDRSRDR
jgi:hypothetical protein